MEKKKCRTCVGCYAYNNNQWKGWCGIGFDTIDLDSSITRKYSPNEKSHVGRTSTGEYWTFQCKPAEPCYKPMSTRQYTEAFNLQIKIIS